MHVVCFLSAKGGSGKSTTACNLAVAAQLAGAGPVQLLDIDPQGTTRHWCERRQSTPALLTDPDLDAAAAAGNRVVIIDTPGFAFVSRDKVIAASDLLVIPVRPTVQDVETVGPTVDLAEKHGRPIVFVVLAATVRSRLNLATVTGLSQFGPVAPTILYARQDTNLAFAEGRAVIETDAGCKSAAEYGALWTYLAERLGKEDRKRANPKDRKLASSKDRKLRVVA